MSKLIAIHRIKHTPAGSEVHEYVLPNQEFTPSSKEIADHLLSIGAARRKSGKVEVEVDLTPTNPDPSTATGVQEAGALKAALESAEQSAKVEDQQDLQKVEVAPPQAESKPAAEGKPGKAKPRQGNASRDDEDLL